MIITRHAAAFFKFQLGDLTIALNPPSKSSKIKASRFGADISIQNTNHPDHSGGEDMNLGGKTPFEIRGPGEYEIRNVFIRGFFGETNYLNKKAINTIYTMKMDGIKVCILGLQSNKNLSTEAKSGISDTDLLFIGIGEDVISPSEAYKLAVSLEPRVIIPFGEKEADIKAFLKEAGSSAKPEDKLTLKRKDLEGKDGDVMVISVT